jgi:hypothetical protein
LSRLGCPQDSGVLLGGHSRFSARHWPRAPLPCCGSHAAPRDRGGLQCQSPLIAYATLFQAPFAARRVVCQACCFRYGQYYADDRAGAEAGISPSLLDRTNCGRRACGSRGVAEPTATLAAEVGSLAFRGTFSRWADPACKTQFAVPTLFSPADRARIVGLFTGTYGLASIIGPLAGGS